MGRSLFGAAVLLVCGAQIASAQPAPLPAPPDVPSEPDLPPPDPATPVGDTPPSPPVPPPAPEPPVPPRAPAPPPVYAADGAAANLEVRPTEGRSVPGALLHGVGTLAGWVVRVVVAPFRGAIYLQARYQLFTKIRNLFVNDAGTLGVYPTLAYKSGFGITYGAQAFWKDIGGNDESLTLNASTGGAVRQAYQVRLDLPRIADTIIYAGLRVRYEEATNLLFAGIGNGDLDEGTNLDARAGDAQTRYGEKRFLGVLGAGLDLGGRHHILRIGGTAIFNDREFDASPNVANKTNLEDVYDPSTLVGFQSGAQTLELTGDIELDTRSTKNPTGTGATVRAFAGGASLVEDWRYFHYGAEAAYHIPLWLPSRVLVVRAALEGVRGESAKIPFADLPRLGGAGLLRGYRTGQFRDKLATVGTVEYHYPIHANVSGELFVEAGKVANEFADIHTTDNLHVGYGGGLIVFSKRSVALRVDLAFGDGLQVYFSTDVLNAFRSRDREL